MPLTTTLNVTVSPSFTVLLEGCEVMTGLETTVSVTVFDQIYPALLDTLTRYL